MLTAIDWIVIGLSFAVCILIVKRTARSVNNTQDYLLAGKKLGRLPTALSTAATDFGGSGLIGAGGLAYSVGIAGSWWDLAAVPAWIILGFTLAVGFRKLELYTVPEYLGKRYNETSRTLASITHVISLSFNTTAQLVVSALAIHSIANVGYNIALVVSAIIVLFFSYSGGLISVVWTDVVQYLILMLGMIIAVPASISAAGGIETIVETVPSSYWDMGALGAGEPIAWGLMCFFGYSVSQSFVQRIFAAKDASTARFAYLFTGVNYLFYAFAVAILGICAFVLNPDLPDPEMAIPELIKYALPVGLRGLVLASIFAATISSATSNLNASTSLFTMDIYKRIIKKEASEQHYLRIAKLTTAFVLGISLISSFVAPNVVTIIVLSNLIYSAGVFFPVILGIYNKRMNGYGALSAIILGGASALISNFMIYGKVTNIVGKIHPMILGSIISLVVLVGVSYLTPSPEKGDKV